MQPTWRKKCCHACHAVTHEWCKDGIISLVLIFWITTFCIVCLEGISKASRRNGNGGNERKMRFFVVENEKYGEKFGGFKNNTYFCSRH